MTDPITTHFSGVDDGPPFAIELQGALRRPGEWFACEHPERLIDRDTAFHDCCKSCLIGAQAAVRRSDGLVVCDWASMADDMAARLDEHGPARRLIRSGVAS